MSCCDLFSAGEPAVPRAVVEAVIQRLHTRLAAWQEENNEPVLTLTDTFGPLGTHIYRL